MSESWYVLRSKPRKETQLYTYLRSKAIETFYPTLKVKPVNPRSSTIRPYFPGYLFVRVDLGEVGKNSLDWMPGSTGLVAFGGEPATIPELFVHDLKQHLAQLKTERESGIHGIKSGDRVRITSGPFAGYEAIFDTQLNGDQRAQVLLQWLGHQLKVEVNANLIERNGVNARYG